MVKLYKISYEELAEPTSDEVEILELCCSEVDGRMEINEATLVDMIDVAEDEGLVLRSSFVERIKWMFVRQEDNQLERKFDFILDLIKESEIEED